MRTTTFPRCRNLREAVVATMAAALTAASIPAAAQPPTTGERQVAFTKDVAPIFQRSCVTCHRPGQSAPMSLVAYEDVRPWVRAIKARVASREMPPWHIDRNVGIQKFKDDPSLTGKEIGTIVRWADNGAPRGDPADMPPPRQFADGSEWAFGKPDLVVRFPAYRVPATGPDLYPDVYANLGLTEDRYIKAIQTRPVDARSRRVVHHAITTMVPGDEDPVTGGDDDIVDAGQFIVEYASGKAPEIFPEDSGVLLKTGHKLKLGYHLHSVGEDIDAITEVGVLLHGR